jgi:hypothetical protein
LYGGPLEGPKRGRECSCPPTFKEAELRKKSAMAMKVKAKEGEKRKEEYLLANETFKSRLVTS